MTFALSRAKPIEPAPPEADLEEADAEKLERELEEIIEKKQAKRRRRAQQQGAPRAIAQAAEARYAPPPPTAQEEDEAEDAAEGDEYRDEGKAAPRSWKPISEEGKRMVLQALDRAIKCVLRGFSLLLALFLLREWMIFGSF